MSLLEQLIGKVLDEKYRIDKKLGQGGMGAVYVSTHLGTKRTVALKVISPEYMTNTEFIERFKREAEAAGRLRHPNVVNVTDFGFAAVSGEKVAYLVMEYLDGSTLGSLFNKKGPLPLGFVVDIVDQVCLAIDRAHQQGVIHRDLKPDNIWLEPTGRGHYNVKVLDFGLAKLRDPAAPPNSDSAPIPLQMSPPVIVDQGAATVISNQDAATVISNQDAATVISNQGAATVISNQDAATVISNQDAAKTISRRDEKLTQPLDPKTVLQQPLVESFETSGRLTSVGAVLGTPLYMSPEQCEGERLDARSDIYSLGVIMYEMLAGETPFKGNMFQLIMKHTQTPPPPLREKNRNIPASVESLIMSALAKNPSDRPSSAVSFAIALRANAEGELPILREATDLCLRRFSEFARLSLRIYFPLVLLLAPIIGLLSTTDVSSPITFSAVFILIPMLIIQFANAVNTAAFALVINQLRQSPNSPVQIDQILSVLLKHLKSILAATAKTFLKTFLGLLKLVKPGVDAYIDSSLYAPVTIIEGVKSDAALARSKILTARLRYVAALLQFRNLTIGFIALLVSLPIFVFSILIFDLLQLIVVPRLYLLTVFAGITTLILIIFHPPIAVALSLAYFKARQAGNEALSDEADGDFDPEDAPTLQTISYKRLTAISITIAAALVIWIAAKDVLLLTAVEKGNIHTVRALIIAGANPNAKDGSGRDPFMIAAGNGYKEVMKALLDAGATVSIAAMPGSQKRNAAVPGMALIEAGNLRMGGVEGYVIEQPVHDVWVDSFYIDETEVTNEQFVQFVKKTSYTTDAEKVQSDVDWKTYATPEKLNHPVVCISWNDAAAYAAWARKRLPTEAEWEYAARGGYIGERYPWGGDSPEDQCNFGKFGAETGLSDIPTKKAKSYKPNGYGLYDMAGNVWEWCSDWYDPAYYRNSPPRNPQGPQNRKTRVLRGGSWYSNLNTIRVAARNSDIVEGFQYDYGFRCAKSK